MSSVNQNGAHPQGCLGCQMMAQELVRKQGTIDQLQATLNSIQNLIRASSNSPELRMGSSDDSNSSQNSADGFHFASFNLGIDIQRQQQFVPASDKLTTKSPSPKLSKARISPVEAMASRIQVELVNQESVAATPTVINQEVRVIKVQEIIDRVVTQESKSPTPKVDINANGRRKQNFINIDRSAGTGLRGRMRGSPKGISKDVLKRLPEGTDIRMVYRNNGLTFPSA